MNSHVRSLNNIIKLCICGNFCCKYTGDLITHAQSIIYTESLYSPRVFDCCNWSVRCINRNQETKAPRYVGTHHAQVYTHLKPSNQLYVRTQHSFLGVFSLDISLNWTFVQPKISSF